MKRPRWRFNTLSKALPSRYNSEGWGTPLIAIKRGLASRGKDFGNRGGTIGP
jgi:hypothetical protein